MTEEEKHRQWTDEFPIPVAPGLEDAVELTERGMSVPRDQESVDTNVVVISALSIGVAVLAAFAAEALTRLIALVTNISFFGKISAAATSPAGTHLGVLMIGIPVIGALIVGVMARYGSAAIRGHGIPEVMERVLHGGSRIPARMMILKPLSAAVAIGTGGPFGSEGPIIATGGALGSIVGQFHRATDDERKTLLAAGAAAGMAATFGTPVAAVLIAIELLLFEYRPQSLIPVSLAAVVAAAIRIAFHGTAPVFPVAALSQPTGEALASYAVIGAAIGALAVGITRLIYGIEDAYEKLPIHWMWWPALGAIAVGVIGYAEPRILGVGYENITGAISGTLVGRALLVLVVLKLIAWAIYIASGTSGGTLAPLFTIGGGLGAWVGGIAAAVAPSLGVDPHVAGLVGMAAIFAGASHALLASAVFAFETTRQPVGLLPILAGCSAAYLVSLLLSKTSIMTERLARRGASVRTEYAVDYLGRVLVRDAAGGEVICVRAQQTLAEARAELETRGRGAAHQGFPVLDDAGNLVGVVTRRDIFTPESDSRQTVSSVIKRRPAVVFDDNTLRDAADHMVLERVGRLPVVTRENPRRVIGIITRSDLLAAHAPRLRAAHSRKRPAWRRRLAR